MSWTNELNRKKIKKSNLSLFYTNYFLNFVSLLNICYRGAGGTA